VVQFLERYQLLTGVADAVEAATVSPRALAKQLQLGNTATLERRIRRELEDIGLCYYMVKSFICRHYPTLVPGS